MCDSHSGLNSERRKTKLSEQREGDAVIHPRGRSTGTRLGATISWNPSSSTSTSHARLSQRRHLWRPAPRHHEAFHIGKGSGPNSPTLPYPTWGPTWRTLAKRGCSTNHGWVYQRGYSSIPRNRGSRLPGTGSQAQAIQNFGPALPHMFKI